MRIAVTKYQEEIKIGERDERTAHCHPGHAVISNPASESFLQKTATLPKMRGDFWHSRKKTIEFGTQRFFAQRKKPANGRLLSDIVGEIS